MPQETLEQVLLNRNPLSKATSIGPNVGRSGVMTPEDEQRILDLVAGMGMGSLKVPFPKPSFGKLAERAGQFIRRFLPERVKPASTPEPEVLDSRITGLEPTPTPKPAQPEMTKDKILDIVLEREQLKRKGTPMPRAQKPRDPRASGMVPGENPDDRLKSIIPEFRSKSGIATDVLEEMKDTDVPVLTGGGSAVVKQPALWEFQRYQTGPEPGKAYPGIASSVNDITPQNVSLPKEVRDILGETKQADLFDDPVGYVGLLRGLDESGINLPREVELPNGVIFKNPEHPFGKEIDKLLQNLSDYFAGPRFDPFLDAATELDKARGQSMLRIPKYYFNK